MIALLLGASCALVCAAYIALCDGHMRAGKRLILAALAAFVICAARTLLGA